MTRDEAMEILRLYRPWSEDEQAPEFAEALKQVRNDPDLARWFERHCAAQTSIRRAIAAIEVPAALKEQIVSERQSRMTTAGRRRRMIVAVVACAVIAMSGYFMWPDRQEKYETSFAAYRSRMVGTALRSYDMELETSDAALIRAHLATNQCRSDYVLSVSLAGATNTGCGALRWQGHRVSMVCFRSGQPLPPGEKTDLFLFVMDQVVMTGAPPADKPKFEQVNKLMTASWSRDGLIYILAAPGGEGFLRKFL